MHASFVRGGKMTDQHKVFNELMKKAQTEKGLDTIKFAESIVRRCAEVLWSIDDGELHEEYVRALKKHFGVK
jgi:hypothetical protein